MSDYFPVEQEYGYSVFSTVFHVEWNNKKLNIIDCPGSDDFVGGAITALNVTDQAVLLINGQYGPEVGTMNAFRNTEKLKKPVIFLVNQLDRDNCDFDQILSQLKEVYGPNCVPVQYPIQTGAGFRRSTLGSPRVVLLSSRISLPISWRRPRSGRLPLWRLLPLVTTH